MTSTGRGVRPRGPPRADGWSLRKAPSFETDGSRRRPTTAGAANDWLTPRRPAFKISFGMPIYEYHCASCRRAVSLLVMRISDPTPPSCPRCGGAELRRLMSRFATIRSEEDRLDSLADPSSLGDLNEDDPKSVARWMKKMGSEMGEDLGRRASRRRWRRRPAWTRRPRPRAPAGATTSDRLPGRTPRGPRTVSTSHTGAIGRHTWRSRTGCVAVAYAGPWGRQGGPGTREGRALLATGPGSGLARRGGIGSSSAVEPRCRSPLGSSRRPGIVPSPPDPSTSSPPRMARASGRGSFRSTRLPPLTGRSSAWSAGRTSPTTSTSSPWPGAKRKSGRHSSPRWRMTRGRVRGPPPGPGRVAHGRSPDEPRPLRRPDLPGRRRGPVPGDRSAGDLGRPTSPGSPGRTATSFGGSSAAPRRDGLASRWRGPPRRWAC